MDMITFYEDANRMSRESMDNALKALSAATRGFQQIAAETTDYTKRSYEQSAQMFEELSKAKSLDKALEIQNDYARTAYQNWVSQATRMGELYADLAKESYKPFENGTIAAANTGTQAAKKAA